MSKQKSSSKHYTTLEKKILIEILKKYSNVIENKKTDSTTLKEKDKTWNIITEEYNSSSNVTEEVKYCFEIYNNIIFLTCCVIQFL